MPDLRKRKCLNSIICPICGRQFSLKDVGIPKGFLSTFGYEERNFYGGNADKFSRAKCCREYYLYFKEGVPSYKLIDIEPVDYDKFMQDLYGEIKADEKVVEKEEPKENTMEFFKEMHWLKIKKYIKDNWGYEFEKTTKKDDVMTWLEKKLQSVE